MGVASWNLTGRISENKKKRGGGESPKPLKKKVADDLQIALSGQHFCREWEMKMTVGMGCEGL